VAGAQYTISLDTSTTESPAPAPAPANTLIPPITGTFPDCTAYQNSSTTPTGCPDTTDVKVYGTYHQVGLHVLNALTHKALAGTTYELCAATTSAPTTGTKTCPSGSTVLATATTDSEIGAEWERSVDGDVVRWRGFTPLWEPPEVFREPEGAPTPMVIAEVAEDRVRSIVIRWNELTAKLWWVEVPETSADPPALNIVAYDDSVLARVR
jgi:hypothetical protein